MNSTSAKMNKYCIERMKMVAGEEKELEKGMERRMNCLSCFLGFHGDRRFVSWSFAIIIAKSGRFELPIFIFFLL